MAQLTLAEWQQSSPQILIFEKPQTMNALESYIAMNLAGSKYDAKHGRGYFAQKSLKLGRRDGAYWNQFVKDREALTLFALSMGAVAQADHKTHCYPLVRTADAIVQGKSNWAYELCTDDAYWYDFEFRRDYPSLARICDEVTERRAREALQLA